MKRIIAMILAGGQGDRLSVLSEERAKPAVIFGGRYRIIDFALSNCVNSGITRVGILTQYRPRSLNDHIGIGRPWDLDRAGGGVSLLQPYLGRAVSDWYRGTADAIYQNLYYVEESRAEHVLLLAGDHVYKMDYDALLDFHQEKGADVTIPVYTVPWEEASRFGTLFLDGDGRVTAFDEKPAHPRSNLISMGTYLFNKDVLIESLVQDAERQDSQHDLGGDVIPHLVKHASTKIYGYRFQGYWRDVGTIEAYYQANMDLLDDLPELNLYDPETHIRTRVYDYPSAKIGRHAQISRSLLSLGCIINGYVEHSVLSPGVYVEEGAVVRDSIIFDDTRIEAGAIIDRSIIDKEVRVRERCHVGYGDDLTPNQERPDIVNCGISIVGKRAELLPGVRVGRNCVIGPGVVASGIEGDLIPSGSTLRGQQRPTVLSV
ncbi:MAG: glucose-1-phosphate adenylyltransferase [Chloroflexi bacterium RBG_16_68_14]|nr:MAG: glucose-1-phosphate adenylyltransferase [Chloroflexi bacterium RBG_16_68_14]